MRITRLLVSLPLLAVGVMRAAYAPQDPSSSLNAWLHDIWSKGISQAYNLIIDKAPVPMSPSALRAFPQQIAGLAASPTISRVAIQTQKFTYYKKGNPPSAREISGAGFIHFMRADEGDDITERIYIDTHPDHAAEVMGFVVRKLMTGPGITGSKIAGPAGLRSWADSIIIYARSLKDVDWCLERLSEYQAVHRDYFRAEICAATRPRLQGVSTAAQPSIPSESFGTYMVKIAELSFNQDPVPMDFNEFKQRVRVNLAKAGVNPDRPDRLTRRP